MEQQAEQSLTIHQRIMKILADVGAIKKEGRNERQGYSFRGIEHIMNGVHSLFAAYGVYITFEVLELIREVRPNKEGNNLIFSIVKVRYDFTGEDGQKASSVAMGEGMDSGDKSLNKAMSGALKYAIQQMLLIPTQDMKDAEGDEDLDPDDNPDRGRDPAASPGRGRRPKATVPPAIPPEKPVLPFDPKGWAALIWHRKEGTFGPESKGPTGETMNGQHFRGHALQFILDSDPKSFAYWVKTYGPNVHKQDWLKGHSAADINLVAALAAAGDELDDLPWGDEPPASAPAETAPQTAPAPEPEPTPAATAPQDPEAALRTKLIDQIRKCLPVHGQDEDWLILICKQYGYVPPTGMTLAEAKTDKLQSLVKNWKVIDGWAKKKQQEGSIA